MLIGGFQKFSLIDYPGKIAAIVFTQGCNFRCPYCHNPELVMPSEFQAPIPEEDVTSFLVSRVDKLQGVVVTGGEPTVQEDVLSFLGKLKGMGYLVKLDTNGSKPQVLRECIKSNLVDFVAMDIKAPLRKYPIAVGVDLDIRNIAESIDIVKTSQVEHVFRTTVLKTIIDSDDLCEINTLIKDSRKYILQSFNCDKKLLDPTLLDKAQYSNSEIDALKQKWER